MAQFYFESKLSSNIDVTPEGFLICRDVAITRSGDFLYAADEVAIEPDANGFVKMWRSIEEVAHPDTIASFEGKPITLLHPDATRVTPDNYSDVTVGNVQNVRRGIGKDNDKLIADLLVMQEQAIAAVMSREMREVSVGFTAEQIQLSPGMGIQAGIRGNHVAIVPEGRAGHEFAIKDNQIKGVEVMSLKDKILKSFGVALDEALPKGEPDGDEDEKDSKSKKDSKSHADAISGLDERMKSVEDSMGEMMDALEEKIKKAVKDCMAQDAKAEKDAKKESKDAKSVINHDGDTLSRAEILAPGVAQDSEDLEMAALNVSYSTEYGKSVIDSMLGTKTFNTMSTDSALKHTIFVAASEIVKSKRNAEQSQGFSDAAYQAVQVKPKYTPDEVNKRNRERYKKQGAK